jgi:hypothetical protein
MTITVSADLRVSAAQTFTNEAAYRLEHLNRDFDPAPTLTLAAPVSVVWNDAAAAAATGYHEHAAITVGNYYTPGPIRAAKGVMIEWGGELRITSALTDTVIIGFDAHGNFPPRFDNYGRVEIQGRGLTVGSTTWSSDARFENHGLFRVVSEGQARGVELNNAGAFVNSGELVVVSGAASTPAAQGSFRSDTPTALELFGWGGRFLNSGTIRVIDGSSRHEAVAVIWRAHATAETWLNRGLIEGEVALRVEPYAGGEAAPMVLTNEGVLRGRVDLRQGDQHLINTGRVEGEVSLGLGHDVYRGGLGVLTGALSGGDGNDTIGGGAGAETLSGDDGRDAIDGGGGDDVIAGGRDADQLDGGEGFDTVSYSHATMAVALDLAAGTASSSGDDILRNFERALGSSHPDTLNGGAGGESLSGGSGADQLHGRGGDDSLEGGAGRDFVRGEDGNDTLAGGAEFDDLHGNMGDDLVRGGDGDDWVVGGKDQDRLHGEEGWDVVLGNLGDDTAEGGAGGDWVRGGQGDDIVRGQDGDDWLAGDRGSDTLTGGAGADIFHAWGEAGVDRITDFNAAEGDRINLLAGSTYTVSQAGADTVIQIGGGAQLVLTGVQLSSLPDGWIFGA